MGLLNCYFERKFWAGWERLWDALGAEVTGVGTLCVCRWGGVGASSEQRAARRRR